MLTEYQIEAIAQEFHQEFTDGLWTDLSFEDQQSYKKKFSFIAEKAIAAVKPYGEQNRRSFIAIGKYIGIPFTAETDVVSEVYNKLDEIMTVFREHSQEIAIAQNIKYLTDLLEKYGKQQETSLIRAGAVGEEERGPVCTGDCGKADSSD
jgi:hypothetical protein